jgi:histidine triad (HIT) family protein
MENCIFCQIVAKKAPAEIFYEDETVVAFPNLDPIVPGHVMVVPKTHATNLLDIEIEALRNLAESTQLVAKKVMAEYNPTGFNLLMANGKDAQQSVPHFHWHIVPRHPHDGLDLWFKHKL